jgi:type IV pilus assembly protein PilW
MTTAKHPHRKAPGFSLVELMVSITIGLIILAAVSTLFVSSKKTYSTQDRLARLQENARFAMLYLSRDIRMAGYFGCLDESTNVNSTLNSGSYIYGPTTGGMIAIEGLENASGNWYPSAMASLPTGIKSGTDAVTIRMSADPAATPITLTKPTPPTSAVFDVSDTTGIADGDIIMLGDCASADILQVTQTPSGLKIQHNTGDTDPPPGNASKPLSKQYKSAQVYKFVVRAYYVRDNAGMPTLYMSENGGDPNPLVEGVEDLQILYGKDTDTTADGVPNVYLKAGEAGLTSSSDWDRVKSVRIGMLVRTLNDKDTDVDIHDTYDVNGTTFTVPTTGGIRDKFQRRVFLGTYQLRNLQ